MPMTVITLTNVPNLLRGDLTKWLQEISIGVYVGNINSRVREELWVRVVENIKQGQATMTYAKRNEIGYDFLVQNAKREVIYYDGIPLVFLPKEIVYSSDQKYGFSNAAKYEKLKKIKRQRNNISQESGRKFVVIDVETTGLNPEMDRIIEIAAVKTEEGRIITFQELVKIDCSLEANIVDMTGITDDLLYEEGNDIKLVLDKFLKFVGSSTLVGYNVKFDMSFINNELKRASKIVLTNQVFCLLQEVKKQQKLLRNYKLNTVLIKYDINNDRQHRALSDAKAAYELALKLNVFG